MPDRQRRLSLKSAIQPNWSRHLKWHRKMALSTLFIPLFPSTQFQPISRECSRMGGGLKKTVVKWGISHCASCTMGCPYPGTGTRGGAGRKKKKKKKKSSVLYNRYQVMWKAIHVNKLYDMWDLTGSFHYTTCELPPAQRPWITGFLWPAAFSLSGASMYTAWCRRSLL